MPHKLVATSPTPEPKAQEKPTETSPPKTEVKGEGMRESDTGTQNELVVQKVSISSTFRGKTTVKDYLRVFVRPDEAHDEPDARWDEHEPEDEAALKQLFATYGKGSGTTISIRLNVHESGKEAFFLDVRHPKPEGDEDEKLPSVLVDPKASIGDIVLDLFYELSEEEPPKDFNTRSDLEADIEEMNGETEELEPIRSLLDEFDMPGDLPAHLDYSLADRLRSILRKAKGLA